MAVAGPQDFCKSHEQTLGERGRLEEQEPFFLVDQDWSTKEYLLRGLAEVATEAEAAAQDDFETIATTAVADLIEKAVGEVAALDCQSSIATRTSHFWLCLFLATFDIFFERLKVA